MSKRKLSAEEKEKEDAEAKRVLQCKQSDLCQIEGAIYDEMLTLQNKLSIATKFYSLIEASQTLGEKSVAWQIVDNNANCEDEFAEFLDHVDARRDDSAFGFLVKLLDDDLWENCDGYLGPRARLVLNLLTRVESTLVMSMTVACALRSVHTIADFDRLCAALSANSFINDCALKLGANT